MDELDKILEYFSLNPEERALHLEDILENSIGFFERFKDTMLNGTPEEKKEIIEKVKILQSKMQEETQKIFTQTGLSEEEMRKFIENPKNFTHEQWDAIQKAKHKIEEQTSDIKKALHPKEAKEKQEKKGPPGKKQRKDWMRS